MQLDITSARLDVLEATVLAIARTLRPRDAAAARYYLAALLAGAEPPENDKADAAAAATLTAVLQALGQGAEDSPLGVLVTG